MSKELSKSPYLSSHTMLAYARNAKAIGVLWAVFTFCYAIVAVLVFFQPYWLGSTDRSEQAGVFGLYQYCTYSRSSDVSVESCRGELADYHRILSSPFKISTVLVGISAIFILLCIACMILFLCVEPKFVYTICACLQCLSFLCLLVGCIVYPAGWDNTVIKSVCGENADKYNKGECELRWSYILAIVGIFDILFLSILAFILSWKQLKHMPSSTGSGVTFSNVAVPMQFRAMPAFNGPSMVSTAIVPTQYVTTVNATNGLAENRMCQFSTAGMKPSNRARAEYAASIQNFQL